MFVIYLIIGGIFIFCCCKALGLIDELPEEDCAYCGDSLDPNDICYSCWINMEKEN